MPPMITRKMRKTTPPAPMPGLSYPSCWRGVVLEHFEPAPQDQQDRPEVREAVKEIVDVDNAHISQQEEEAAIKIRTMGPAMERRRRG